MTKPVEPKVRIVYKPLVRKSAAGEDARGDEAGAWTGGLSRESGVSGEQGVAMNESGTKAVSARPVIEGSVVERAPDANAVKSENANAAFLRAANEDDDGYDPYSDRQEVRPLFEADPWN